MTTIHFQEIKRTAKKRVPCAGGCGRKLTRQTTFSQTLNPFNRNADGTVKSPRDISAELWRSVEEWEPHAVCKDCAPRQATP